MPAPSSASSGHRESARAASSPSCPTSPHTAGSRYSPPTAKPTRRHPVSCRRPSAARGLRRQGHSTPSTARTRVRARLDTASPDDLLLLDDLLGIRTPRRRRPNRPGRETTPTHQPDQYGLIGPHHAHRLRHRGRALDRRRQRLHARRFHRGHPPYTVTRGDHLSARVPRRTDRLPRSQTIALAPLDDSQTTSLTAELLGIDSSIGGLAARIAEPRRGQPVLRRRDRA